MSPYAKYILEREGARTIESEKGFISYKFFGQECFIHTLYVEPEYRRKGAGTEFFNQVEAIAKEAECKVCSCTVSPKAIGATDSLMAILATGFQLVSSDNEKIVLIKEIE